MSQANRRRSATASSDLEAFCVSDRLWEIVRNGVTASFQPIYAVGEKVLFAVAGFIRGPVGDTRETPEQLFQAALETGMSPALDGAAYISVLMQGHFLGKPTEEPNVASLSKGFWDALQRTPQTEAL